MMDPRIAAELNQENMTEFHKKMLEDSKALANMSRRVMSRNYAKWDHNDQTYSQSRVMDEQDRKARERKEPEKSTIPTAYSQIQTFISFCFSLYTQRERIFELQGMNQESQMPAKVAEALLARDLQHNAFEIKLYQFLLDIGRFGIGVFKTGWKRETQRVRTQVPVGMPGFSFLGMNFGGKTEEQIVEQVKYLGNDIMNVSPYRFYPDVRLPLVRFQEGEFCASEDEYSYTTLKQMEKQGEIVGTQFLRPMTKNMLADRGESRWSQDSTAVESDTTSHSGQTKGTYVLTEVQRVIIPNEYLIEGKPLGEEDYPIKYVIAYVNDTRVVRCEPLNYLHDKFTYDLGMFSPDLNRLTSTSLSDSIDALQSIISWFINSRIASVRKVISNYLVVDPEGIEMKDLRDRNPIIRTKPTVSGRGVDKFIKQLAVQDVTQGHIEDAKFLQDYVQLTTGINDNILGNFYTGRRSATEARNVNSSAAARLKTVAVLLFNMALEPMAQKMLSNLRDGLDEETLVKLTGVDGEMDQQNFLPVTKEQLVGTYDFEVFDGTLPSEKNLIAQSIENYLMALMKNPEAAIALGMDPRAMLLEAMELRGIRNPRRFTLKTPPQQTGAPQPGQPQLPGAQPPQAQIPNGPESRNAPVGGFSDLIQGGTAPGAGSTEG